INDLSQIKNLAIKSWNQFESELTTENWQRLKTNLSNDKTFLELLERSYCLVCENENKEIIGMSFLVPHGNPTEIYDEKWCYIRFVSVDPECRGKGIGRQLTKKCIQFAIDNKEQTIALHTSEMMNNARHIYESLGFKIVKELDQRLGKRYWLYTLDIG
ncbi:MAG TPA: GNAT family N-acetyltransferase, partial [Hanamia sp.]